MAIYLDKNSKVIVQGITGREGLFHTQRMLAYGTNIVGGVTPGKGGSKIESGQPVFNTVKDAVDVTGATHTIIFVPPPFAADALYEAYDAGISLAVAITEGIPAHDMLKLVATTKSMRIIGPNCPGLVSPGKALVGIMPGHVFKEGRIGMISRSGTLTYEIVDMLSKAGLGQSTCVGIGGDPIIGTTFVDCLEAFASDPETDAVVVCGDSAVRMKKTPPPSSRRICRPNPRSRSSAAVPLLKASVWDTRARSSRGISERPKVNSLPSQRPAFPSPTAPRRLRTFFKSA